MKVILFAGAEIRDYSFCESYMDGADAVICCDAGMRHAKALGIDPDYIVGDFDSTASEVLEYYKAKNIPIRQFPTRKNETDMELGIILALELGATDLVLFGGIGDRFDHTLANAHYLLSLLKKGVRARLVDDKNCVEVIDRQLTLHGKVGDLVFHTATFHGGNRHYAEGLFLSLDGCDTDAGWRLYCGQQCIGGGNRND